MVSSSVAAPVGRQPAIPGGSPAVPVVPPAVRAMPAGVPSCAVVDLDAVRDNVVALRGHAGGTPLMAVVKADGYGHGMLPVARAALDAGPRWLGAGQPGEAGAPARAGRPAPAPAS